MGERPGQDLAAMARLTSATGSALPASRESKNRPSSNPIPSGVSGPSSACTWVLSGGVSAAAPARRNVPDSLVMSASGVRSTAPSSSGWAASPSYSPW